MTDFRVSKNGLEVWNTKTGEIRVSQNGLEVWNTKTGDMRASQIEMEVWTLNPSVPRSMVVTQAGLEAWLINGAAFTPPPFVCWLE